jgi:predicted small lipoprotein YifL
MRNAIIAPLLAVVFATLWGCGQMGPLYMPPPEETAEDKPVQQADQPQQQSEES